MYILNQLPFLCTDYTTHDIALLLLNEPVPIDGQTIDVMPLPYLLDEKMIPFGTTCGGSGWGCQLYGNLF